MSTFIVTGVVLWVIIFITISVYVYFLSRNIDAVKQALDLIILLILAVCLVITLLQALLTLLI